ncbi:hypothetical protein MHH81_03900 [Psychrobacillus sp. FSL H8-0484]
MRGKLISTDCGKVQNIVEIIWFLSIIYIKIGVMLDVVYNDGMEKIINI